jgi:hypothetical protein
MCIWRHNRCPLLEEPQAYRRMYATCTVHNRHQGLSHSPAHLHAPISSFASLSCALALPPGPAACCAARA